MTRPLRIEYPRAVCRLTSRENERKAALRNVQEQTAFLNTLRHQADVKTHAGSAPPDTTKLDQLFRKTLKKAWS